jgi:hypothetical protein
VDEAKSSWTAETATRAAEASRELERMDLFEETAMLHDREPVQDFRTQLALRYRDIIGVHPDDRGKFRNALERVADGGGMSVMDLKAHFNRQ